MIKYFSVLLSLLVCAALACSDDESCDAGDMRCSGNVSQMCSADGELENYRDCAATGDSCSTEPANCSGYSGSACCF